MCGCAAAALLIALLSCSAMNNFSVAESPTEFSNCTADEPVIKAKCHPMLTSNGRSESKCCSLNSYNSSYHRPFCYLEGPSEGGAQMCRQYELLSCENFILSLTCHVNTSGNDRVAWRRTSDGLIMRGRLLQLRNVGRNDSATYACEVTDVVSGELRKRAQVILSVQCKSIETAIPPVILVPNQSQFSVGDRLECKSEANPPASITWYRSDIQLSHTSYETEVVNCSTRSEVQLDRSDSSLHGNYTCLASNVHGQSLATLHYTGALTFEDGSRKRRFNVTGFIVGMLPPLFISFYIILKLGYRSRYAEERGEDDGVREEPFFISY